MKNYLMNSVLLCMICMSSLTVCAADDNDIIEFQGDRYVIHVEKMNPDSEMTLLDVLHTCPEFLSINGKKLDLNYSVRVDNIGIVVDMESFLNHGSAVFMDEQLISCCLAIRTLYSTLIPSKELDGGELSPRIDLFAASADTFVETEDGQNHWYGSSDKRKNFCCFMARSVQGGCFILLL